MESILRLIKNNTIAIERNYGLSQVAKIVMNNKHGEDFFTESKNQSKAVDFFSQEGRSIGNDIDTITNGVAVISINGVMTAEDGWCNVGMATYDKILRQLYSNSKVEGIIIKMDTGGGYVDAGTILYNAIQDKNKPVVVLSNFLASAGILGTLGADEIIAQTTVAEFGSIGVYQSLSKEGLNWYKENMIDVYSSKSPDKNKAIRDAINGDFEALTESVTRTDDRFMELVQDNRKITDETTLNGGMFQAKEAKRRGLIDSIGSLNYAIKRIYSLNNN